MTCENKYSGRKITRRYEGETLTRFWPFPVQICLVVLGEQTLEEFVRGLKMTEGEDKSALGGGRRVNYKSVTG